MSKYDKMWRIMVLLELQGRESLLISGEIDGRPSERFIYTAMNKCLLCNQTFKAESSIHEADAIERLRDSVYKHQCPEALRLKLEAINIKNI